MSAPNWAWYVAVEEALTMLSAVNDLIIDLRSKVNFEQPIGEVIEDVLDVITYGGTASKHLDYIYVDIYRDYETRLLAVKPQLLNQNELVALMKGAGYPERLSDKLIINGDLISLIDARSHIMSLVYEAQALLNSGRTTAQVASALRLHHGIVEYISKGGSSVWNQLPSDERWMNPEDYYVNQSGERNPKDITNRPLTFGRPVVIGFVEEGIRTFYLLFYKQALGSTVSSGLQSFLADILKADAVLSEFIVKVLHPVNTQIAALTDVRNQIELRRISDFRALATLVGKMYDTSKDFADIVHQSVVAEGRDNSGLTSRF